MEQEELDLWKMVDVGWYASFRLVFKIHLEEIRANVREGERDVQQLWDSTKDRYQQISTRFEKMDLELLDDRFPVRVLEELKGEVFPRWGERYNELDLLLTQYISGSTTVNESIPSKIGDCLGLVERMRILGKEFGKNMRYREYRKTQPCRIYLD